tara:strand:+ start:1847 stop:2026 length:180 start_codon:yes stop_codon:yes gene_type:complete
MAGLVGWYISSSINQAVQLSKVCSLSHFLMVVSSQNIRVGLLLSVKSKLMLDQMMVLAR